MSFVGMLLEDTGEMERFIRKHSDDRTMLEKLRDVVRTIRRKLGNSPEAKRFRETEKLLSAALDKSVETVKKSEQTAEKNTTESGGVAKYMVKGGKRILELDIAWDADNESTLKTQLKEHLGEINEMAPVTSVTYEKEKGKPYYERLDDVLRQNFGYRISRADGVSFLFDEAAIGTLRKYITSDAEAAAAIASPYVLKRGKIISGHRNHKNHGYPSITIAAPATLNEKTGNIVVSVLFSDKDRVHSLRVLTPDGKEFVLEKTKAGSRMGERTNEVRESHPHEPASNGKVSQPEPKVKGKFSYKDYTAQEKQEHNKTALEHFGKTYRWNETGYLLLNGEKLDFSGRHDGAPGGYRTVDHRDIKEALGLDYGGEDYSGAMVQFMGEGNIRISPENNGINLSVVPTDAQERALEDYISRVRGEVIVDLDDLNGNTLESIEYPRGTRASKVLSDIRNYFAEGIVPQVSEVAKYRYSLKDASGLTQELARIQREGKELGHSDAEIQAEIRAAVDEAYSGMIEEYGAMEAGENPAREVQVPKRTSKNEKVSQTVRTILEAEATPDVIIPDIEQLVAEGEFSYESYTDKEAIADATAKVGGTNGGGWERAYAEWDKAMDKGEVSKENTTMGWVLYNNAANSGNTQLALDILNKMVEHQRNAAQALQATRILKKLSPDAQLYGAQRSVANLQRELTEKYGEKAPDLKIDTELAERFLRARTDEGRAAAMRDIYRDIGRQMPSRFIDKWNAWRYLAMLGNPRTHVRNIAGNLGFVPFVAAKNVGVICVKIFHMGCTRTSFERDERPGNFLMQIQEIALCIQGVQQERLARYRTFCIGTERYRAF